MNRIFALTLVAAAVMAGCSTLSPNNAMLDQARSDYLVAQDTSRTRELAGGELKQAGDALAKANEAQARGDKAEDVSHLAYLAKQRTAIAQETGNKKGAERDVANADAVRDKIRLAARTDEADKAHRTAEAAALEADSAKRASAQSQQQASDAQARNRLLEAQLQAMNAKKTDRGYVITIGDVFFDTDKSQLKAGGLHSVESLATYLKAAPERKVLIEGFTDSTGAAGHNQELSSRRADAVRTALMDMGISRDRADIHGFGEAYPVAGNETAGGRQLNRRVEVLLSDENGKIIPR